MKNLRIQNGCYNCKHLFVYDSYEEYKEYYCSNGAKKRPLCGSNKLGESFTADLYEHNQFDHWNNIGELNKKDDIIFIKRTKEWKEWSKDRNVKPYNICDNHSLRKNNE